ncbi:type II toxin-antitoxin system VapB family antitoxin [Neorhizobium alkalisoli]|uniref:VapB protein of antitoxin of type II toxin-antitoxin system n=1 Tax=Neorhizobium alkalisoli TaxID=528178 RepID=A0A561R2Y6_9HYPH|nr:type II toxin-antitoxin system VapB family antitoxin [Neorhizobium alkalisoli]TWF56961.1 VapB protein of antitoxin of type II toxin-antitoxin system [Neorhizobium alkalisoli]
MRTTITIDDQLIERAQEVTGITERSALIKRALTQMIEREAALRLIALGGSEPDAKAPPRRRWNTEESFGSPE